MNLSTTPFPSNRRGAGQHLHVLDRGPLSRHDKLVKQTRKWVAMSFFEPLLKQVREDPFHSTMLDGGEAGKAFGSMYDERLAESMTSDASDSLVHSIVDRIEAKQGGNASRVGQRINSEREGADRWKALRAKGNSHLFHGDNHVPPYI
ncbi:MAG TPA: hypothetical protein VHX86_05375 [Tepidisphaeraceae bacterium]|jgi:Rod binding domain-containing protein|nr:hypothetical protein [Tepidisphaeraceae bacterium]